MERNLMIAGFGGQGVMTMGKLLAEATSQATDLNVTFFPSYGAAMRGGTWQPTPVLLPGESQGRGSLVGCRLWGHRVRHD